MKQYKRIHDLHRRNDRDWKIVSKECCFEDMISILRMFSVSDKPVSVKSYLNRNRQRVYSISAYLSDEEYEIICQ